MSKADASNVDDTPSPPDPNRRISIALAGNPNCGKTTIFNALTGARQHVGNYPGVTVSKKEGRLRRNGRDIDVVDLPGTYSLTAYSQEEVIARNFVVNDRPDVVIDIIDSSNLERNLYLAVQLMELGAPLVLAFNMSDVAEARGFSIDIDALSALLGVPIVRTVGHKRKGIDDLLEAAISVADAGGRSEMRKITYDREIEQELAKIIPMIEELPDLPPNCSPRWLAVKLIEHDSEVAREVKERSRGASSLFEAVEAASERIAVHFGDAADIVIADKRYGFISGACQETVRSTVEARHLMSDRIDSVATNRILGIPIFLGLMFLVFKLTFTLGDPAMGLLESGFAWLAGQITMLWPKGAESAVKSLLVNGIIGGVGGVMSFLPNILLLFMAIAFLEDSGYMARAAFIMDRLMHKIGLHGKSFIPMLIGFGCSVPAIMATRTLETRRDRLTTMLILPLMSCGARLTIYTLLIPAFFPLRYRSIVMWLIYLIGILLAVGLARLLRSTIFKGEVAAFVMELPPYRVPTVNGTLLHMWERGRMYVKKAGTTILVVSIILWALTSYPKKSVFDKDYDQLRSNARDAYIAGSSGIASGLPVDVAIMEALARAELAAEATRELFFEHEDGFVAAERNTQAVIEKLKNDAGGAFLGAMLDAREAVSAELEAFAETVADLTENADLLTGSEIAETEAYAGAKADHEAKLAKLKAGNPEAFAAAVAYIETVRGPYDDALRVIDSEQAEESLTYTISGRIGRALEPLVKPIGFDWRINTALIGSMAAKEVFVAQMSIVFSLGEEDMSYATLRARLRETYSPLVGFCMMLFCLISAPCVATLAMTRHESGSWKWAALQLGILTAMAYVVTLVVYQVGSLLL